MRQTDIGYTIIKLLEKNNMSQRELAKMLRIAPTTLNGYIRNKHEPDYVTLVNIADIFGVTTDRLLNHKSGGSADEGLLARKLSVLDADQKELIAEMVDIMSRQNLRRK